MEIWCVGTGDDSKEVEAQRNRIRRESEVIYRGIHEIPSDPRDPWDREMDYDDTLTPEIPMEQILDNEPLKTLGTSSVSAYGSKENVAPVVSKSSVNMPEPDLELLAELLRNPELVFALTSGGAGDPLSDETVKLLDMIRRNSVTSLGSLGGKACNKVEVSLRSPTSSGNIANQQVPDFDFSRNRLLQQPALTKGRPYEATAVFHSVQPKEICPHITFINPQNWPTVISAPQPSATFNQSAHMAAPPVTSPQTSIQLPEQWRVPTNPPMHHQCTQPSSSDIHSFTPKIMLNDNSMGNVRTSPMCVEMPLRATQDLESIYYNQQSATLNNAYDGGPVHAAVLAGSWNGRNKLIQRAEFESWGRDSSTLRHNEYIPGKNFHGPRMNLRHGRAI